jgi:GntR family transcriptional repressor for pyruvate dehydrogenase complex
MFESVKSNKVSEHIIEQIRKAIFGGKLKPGDRLPYERELLEEFRVSRATLREALRSLEVLGFLEIRKGASGGAFVREVDMEKARDSFTNFLLFKNLSLKDLSEVRLLLEPYVAEKAALTITKEDLNGLEKLIKEHEYYLKNDKSLGYQKSEIEFHRIIGSMIGNPILMFILNFVEDLLIDAKEALKPSKEFSKKVNAAHKRIYHALLERNAEQAHVEMAKHIREVEKDLLKPRKEEHIKEINFKRMNHRESFPFIP